MNGADENNALGPLDYMLNGIETKRLAFRALSASDFNAWLPFHKDPRTSQYWNGLPNDATEACKQLFEATFNRYRTHCGGLHAVILKTTGKLVGLCGLLLQTIMAVEELEIGYYFLPHYWGKGYASEAALACKTYAAKTKLSNSLVAIISVENLPSQKIAEHLGMKKDFETMYSQNRVYIFHVKL